jgi:hypothetical protein
MSSSDSLTNYGPSTGYSMAPEKQQVQTPPLQSVIDSGLFKAWLTSVVRMERGTASRFWFACRHISDGAITSWVSGPTLTIIDQFGNAVLASYFTLTSVNPDQGMGGRYYCDVTSNTIGPEAYYEAQWTGSYQPKIPPAPIGTPAQAILFRRQFRVQVTKAPSKFFFRKTSQF